MELYLIESIRIATLLIKQLLGELKQEGVIERQTEHSQIKFLNNVVESDHGRIKQRLAPMLGFKSFASAGRCIKGIETMTLFANNQITFINKLFNLHSLDFAI
jgi:transposase-like protein